VGLAGMRERMQDLGGELGIERSESGTLISATIPLASDAGANFTPAAD
jgi:signal transduction histidine kinase